MRADSDAISTIIDVDTLVLVGSKIALRDPYCEALFVCLFCFND